MHVHNILGIDGHILRKLQLHQKEISFCVASSGLKKCLQSICDIFIYAHFRLDLLL